MPSNNYQLSDISQNYLDGSLEKGSNKKPSGMYITTAKAFILAFLAIAIAVGVGIIVHFASPGRSFDCKCSYPTINESSTGGSSASQESCKALIQGGNAEICTACPAQGSCGTCPTSAPTQSTTKEASFTSPAPNATTGTSPTTAPPIIDVRLPLTLRPLLYTIELQPHMYTTTPSEFTFNGSVRILLHCEGNTNNITLHVKQLNITDEVWVQRENDILNMYASHEFDADRQFLIVFTKQTLEAGLNYSVTFKSFTGPLAPDSTGLFLSSYTSGNETIYFASSQMQPTDARKVFPCFDEPAFKSEFEVTVVRKSHMFSISNMPVTGSINRGNTWVADTFERTPMMSTYLLAFIVCDFNYTQDVARNNVTFRAFSRPDAIEQTTYSLKAGVELIAFFEDYFDIKYPLPKQDMIAIPDLPFDGMENWGLSTYHEAAMLYEPGLSSQDHKQRVASVVAHELGHQWFGNLVSPYWWDDLWLNEGFASYVQNIGVDYLQPDWKIFERFVVDDLHDVFSLDGLISSHPVYVPVSHPDEILEIFDKISYIKGASIIRMMRFFLGDTTFKRGLTRYLKNLAYGVATHDDLWFALGNILETSRGLALTFPGMNLCPFNIIKNMKYNYAKEPWTKITFSNPKQSIVENQAITNVREIMDTWILQMNYPVVMVKHTAAGRISLSQDRYLQDRTAIDPGKYTSPFGYRWYIPFAYTTNKEKNFNVNSSDVFMMTTNDDSLVISSTDIPTPDGTNWVLGNPLQHGYYRVNYDERNWNALIKQLIQNHKEINPINRAQIINDAWSLARSGDLRMNIALRTTDYLNKEREYVPWKAASKELSFVSSMLQRHSLYGSFKKFMQNKTLEAFVNQTMNNTGASPLQTYVRSLIAKLACSFGIKECVDESKLMFSEWMADSKTNLIDPELKPTIYCTAIAEGDLPVWEFALEQYRMSNVAAQKSNLLSALTCTKQTWILSRLLKMAINPNEIGSQDAALVIVGVSKNAVGRSLAWDFLREKWDFWVNEFSTGAGTFLLSHLISGVTESFNTQFDYDQLKAFADGKDGLASVTSAFVQALERAQNNVHWMTANVPIIENWLTEQRL